MMILSFKVVALTDTDYETCFNLKSDALHQEFLSEMLFKCSRQHMGENLGDKDMTVVSRVVQTMSCSWSALKIEESLNVTFDETPPPFKTSPLMDDDLDEEEAIRETKKKNLDNVVEDETLEIDEIVNIKESRNHPLENVPGNLNQ
ncbi:hypothetical protein Tco_0972062 [Tanacetum coccineum]